MRDQNCCGSPWEPAQCATYFMSESSYVCPGHSCDPLARKKHRDKLSHCSFSSLHTIYRKSTHALSSNLPYVSCSD